MGLSPLKSGLWSVVSTPAGRENRYMVTTSGPMVHDELEAVVSALCVKFPTRSRREVESVVSDVYRQLAATATITAHLIPLTLNRSRRVLSSPGGAIRGLESGLLAVLEMTNAPGQGPAREHTVY